MTGKELVPGPGTAAPAAVAHVEEGLRVAIIAAAQLLADALPAGMQLALSLEDGPRFLTDALPNPVAFPRQLEIRLSATGRSRHFSQEWGPLEEVVSADGIVVDTDGDRRLDEVVLVSLRRDVSMAYR